MFIILPKGLLSGKREWNFLYELISYCLPSLFSFKPILSEKVQITCKDAGTDTINDNNLRNIK